MRVTERMRWVRTQRQIDRSSSRHDRASQEALSGQRVTRSSDDIFAHQSAKRLEQHSSRQRAFMSNAQSARMELDRMDSVLTQSHDVLARARELSVQFGDASYGPDEMSVAAEEVATLKGSIIRLANTEHRGRSLFGGTQQQRELVDGAGQYTGAVATPRQITIGESGTHLTMQTVQEAFGDAGQSAFDALDAFEAALTSGDTAAVRGAQGDIDEALDRLEGALQRVGHDSTSANESIRFAEQMVFHNEAQVKDLTSADFLEAIATMERSSMTYELSLKIASEQKQLARSILSL